VTPLTSWICNEEAYPSGRLKGGRTLLANAFRMSNFNLGAVWVGLPVNRSPAVSGLFPGPADYGTQR
jgi:hypothetical protein